jgi:hypothetical protein
MHEDLSKLKSQSPVHFMRTGQILSFFFWESGEPDVFSSLYCCILFSENCIRISLICFRRSRWSSLPRWKSFLQSTYIPGLPIKFPYPIPQISFQGIQVDLLVWGFHPTLMSSGQSLRSSGTQEHLPQLCRAGAKHGNMDTKHLLGSLVSLSRKF